MTAKELLKEQLKILAVMILLLFAVGHGLEIISEAHEFVRESYGQK